MGLFVFLRVFCLFVFVGLPIRIPCHAYFEFQFGCL